MGKTLSHLKRPFLNFNIESRAEKIISRDKPVPAPKHEVSQAELDRILRENPQEFQNSLEKNEQLEEHLKNVFVTSEKTILKHSKTNPSRPLPLNRRSYEEPLFGIVEPERIPKGKVSIINALKFVTDHHANPRGYNANVIAKQFSLEEATVKNILRYCKPFQVYIPENAKSKVNFAGPAIQKITIKKRPLKQIESRKDKEIDSGKKKEDT